MRSTTMNFDSFTSIPFPRDEDVVYVLCFKRPGSSDEVPFYVGESGRGTRRLSDYMTAQFAAPTDFKVGVVVKTLQGAGAEVTVKYKLSADRKAEEARLIKQAGFGYTLLNHAPSFNYKTDNKDEQLTRFQALAMSLLSGSNSRQIILGDV